MDLRQLRHFVTVVRFGSFSMAAENLRVTQPALSKSLRALEQSLGVRLLDRGPAGVRMTLFGERLLGYGELVLSLTDEAVDEIDALRGARRGMLHIGGMAAVLRTMVPDAITRFVEARPDVGVVIHEGLNDPLLDSLYAGKLDIVISVPPVDMLHDDYEWRPLREEPVDIVAGKSHPLAARERLRVEELVPYAWVVPPRPEPDRLNLDALFVAAGFPKPRIAVETTSVIFLDAMLCRTEHLSYLTRSTLQGYDTDLAPLRLADKTWSRTLCAVFRRKGVIRPTVLAFVRELERICRAAPV
jgi:DNA-binding transcriptional LysR family regulator